MDDTKLTKEAYAASLYCFDSHLIAALGQLAQGRTADAGIDLLDGFRLLPAELDVRRLARD